jgi:hypothetical protein
MTPLGQTELDEEKLREILRHPNTEVPAGVNSILLLSQAKLDTRGIVEQPS